MNATNWSLANKPNCHPYLSIFYVLLHNPATQSRTSPSAWTIYLGRQTQRGSNPNEVLRHVSRVIVHPNYNNTLFNNDIALMKLSSAVSYNNYIRPICLASSSSLFNNATTCWASGWGDTTKNGECLLSEAM